MDGQMEQREGWMDAWMHAQVDEWIRGGWVDGQETAEGWDQHANQEQDSRRGGGLLGQR